LEVEGLVGPGVEEMESGMDLEAGGLDTEKNGKQQRWRLEL